MAGDGWRGVNGEDQRWVTIRFFPLLRWKPSFSTCKHADDDDRGGVGKWLDENLEHIPQIVEYYK